MNAKILLPLALSFLILSRGLSQTPPLISVTGSAEVKVVPDEIHLNVGVETRNASLGEAKRENDENISSALAFLKKSGVPEKNIQTDYISLEPSYNNNNDSQQTQPRYFIVRKSIAIKLTEITSFEGILTGLLTNGVNTIHGIDFRTTELRRYRDTARSMAIRAARDKADDMAAVLGVKRGKVYSISENDWGGNVNFSYWGARGGGMLQNGAQSRGESGDSTGDTLSLGQISVSASVSVSFLIP